MQISDCQQLLGTTNEEHLPNGYEISFGHDENTWNRQSWQFPNIMKVLNATELFILKTILCYMNFTSKLEVYSIYKGFPGGSAIKNLPAIQETMQETQV